jgi:hypothetical protein
LLAGFGRLETAISVKKTIGTRDSAIKLVSAKFKERLSLSLIVSKGISDRFRTLQIGGNIRRQDVYH